MKSILNKFYNFGLLVLCLFYMPFRGLAKKVSKEPKKIIILRWTPHMGDVVYTTPMFSAIKKKYPDCQICVVGRGRVEEVIRYNPEVDKFIEYKDNFWETVRKIRQEKFDFGCVAKPGASEGFALLYLGGVKAISIFDVLNEPKVRSATYPFMLKLGVSVPFYNHQYIPPQFLKLLEPLDIKNPDVHFHLYFSPEAESKINSIFKENNIEHGRDFIVALAPGGSTEERWWPADRFAELAKYLVVNHHAKILFLGAGIDKKAIDGVIQNLSDTPHINLLNQNLDDFKATVSKCSLVIGNDSGPMVTADAFNIPQMIFVGPTDPREYHTLSGPTYKILQSSDRKLTSISTDTAFKELYNLLYNLSRVA
ncbi:MAG: heptosyltransferase II [Parcubacteria group bacterium Gr01-1014_44]|nr:MAG: heptosyltransferase II [Parcubacteria group bacterium Gr01-1014_44]